VIQHRISAERKQNRCRIRQASGFNNDAAKPPDLAGVTAASFRVKTL